MMVPPISSDMYLSCGADGPQVPAESGVLSALLLSWFWFLRGPAYLCGSALPEPVPLGLLQRYAKKHNNQESKEI